MNKLVTILTGFLGAGKTTFLNHLIEENPDTRYAIIENEFGEQGIDNELIYRPDETIVQLNNGCLCCTLNDNLYDILNELFDRKDEFDEIIIEATGVADPTGLAQPFISHPLIKKHFPLRAIICLVDAELIEDHLIETEEALNQISYSDILLINKVDLVDESYIRTLEKKLTELNPLAHIEIGSKNNFPAIDKSFNNHQKLEALFLSATEKKEEDNKQTDFPVKKPHTHHHHHHTKEIHSLTFTFETPFDFHALHHRLIVYITFQAKSLHRIKGLVWFEGKDGQFILQSVGRRLDFDPNQGMKTDSNKKSMLVFIGKNLPKEGIQKMLNQCLSKSKTLAE